MFFLTLFIFLFNFSLFSSFEIDLIEKSSNEIYTKTMPQKLHSSGRDLIITAQNEDKIIIPYSMHKSVENIKKYAKKHKKERILVAFDLDWLLIGGSGKSFDKSECEYGIFNSIFCLRKMKNVDIIILTARFHSFFESQEDFDLHIERIVKKNKCNILKDIDLDFSPINSFSIYLKWRMQKGSALSYFTGQKSFENIDPYFNFDSGKKQNSIRGRAYFDGILCAGYFNKDITLEEFLLKSKEQKISYKKIHYFDDDLRNLIEVNSNIQVKFPKIGLNIYNYKSEKKQKIEEENPEYEYNYEHLYKEEDDEDALCKCFNFCNVQ